MDSNCRKLGETPYRACRKQAAIYNDALGSMERAAEMLGVSVNTLSNYELGVTVPPVDIIIVMADLYDYVLLVCRNELDYNELQRKLGIQGAKVSMGRNRTIKGRAIWYDQIKAQIVEGGAEDGEGSTEDMAGETGNTGE